MSTIELHAKSVISANPLKVLSTDKADYLRDAESRCGR